MFDYLQWRLAQSICLAVNKQAKSLTQMAEQVGAELAYVEDMAQRLTDMEVLRSPKPKQYLANFIAFEAEDWKRLTALTRQPTGDRGRATGGRERRGCGRPLRRLRSRSGWSREDVKWPMYTPWCCATLPFNGTWCRRTGPPGRCGRAGGGTGWAGTRSRTRGRSCG